MNSQEQNKDVGVLLDAMQKVIEMNRQHALDQYGDANKAESWACVRVLREAMAASPVVRAQSEERALTEANREGWAEGMQEAQGLLDGEIQDAARYSWLKERFTGYDFYWGGDCMAEREEDKGKCVIVFECGKDFRGGRDFEQAIDAAIRAAQEGGSHEPR